MPVSLALVRRVRSFFERVPAGTRPIKVGLASRYGGAGLAMLLTACVAHGAQPDAGSGRGEIGNFAALEQALAAGMIVSVHIDFSRCTLVDGHTGPDLHGGLRVNSYLVMPDGSIAFIDEHRSLDQQNRPTTEFVRYHIAPEVATIDVSFVADSSSVAVSRGQYKCPINQGISFREARLR